ncbi:tyrosine-type recombinase/integrase [Bacillus paramycoides]|uniref:site-specific integrase n=1 Tax=Bacillus paramycoides TaxID=2026194 RepID=UPI002E23DE47|nr:tyrosine-type recombinase/integrase [Bacillus paramycoides]MED0983007.1 tyrosine-type recombinase/integrase [Bacillus paramycoides]
MKGYFHKRGDRWSFTIDIGIDPMTGKRKQKSKSGFKTKKEAQNAAATMITELEKGIYFDDQQLTVLDIWGKLKPIRKAELKITSYEKDMSLVRLYILPPFGYKKIKSIKPVMIQSYYAELKEQGLSNGTISNIHRCLRCFFKHAVEWEIIHDNIMNKVKKPREEQGEMKTWSSEECNRFLQYLKRKNNKYYMFFLLAIYTGMRRGELLALTWKDIDFENKRIVVNKSLVKTETGLSNASTKTKSSNRSISISPFVVQELLSYYTYKKKELFRWGIHLQEENYIFSGNALHDPLHPDAPHQFLKIHYERAGVPRIRIHDLRHTHATLMLQAGEHPKIVQDRLGHSSIHMTLDKYSHVTQNMQQQAAENFESVLKSYENVQ